LTQTRWNEDTPRMYNNTQELRDKTKQNQTFLGSTDDSDFDLQKATRMMFELSWCEFEPNESAGFLDNVSNRDTANIEQKLVFSYKGVDEKNVYRFLGTTPVSDYLVNTLDTSATDFPPVGYDLNSINNPVPGTIAGPFESAYNNQVQRLKLLEDKAKSYTKKSLANAFENRLLSEVQSQISNLILGNVYGFNPGGVIAALGSGSVSGLQNAAGQVSRDAGSSINNVDPDRGIGNIYK